MQKLLVEKQEPNEHKAYRRLNAEEKIVIKKLGVLLCTGLAVTLLCLAACSTGESKSGSSSNNLKEIGIESGMEKPKNSKEIYLAGGCFWGLEAYLKQLPGVWDTDVGYANGNTENPSYEEVCSKNTGHAEAVHLIYDPEILDLNTLLAAFFKVVDPLSENRQGNDVGSQYRSGIFYSDNGDKEIIDAAVKAEQEKHSEPIKTQVLPLDNYYLAEEYHQDYLEKNPGGYCHINLDDAQSFIKDNADKFKDLSPLILKENYPVPSEEELKKRLTDTQYKVTQEGDTERPYANLYSDNTEQGLYVDVVTGEPLFTSIDKFDSGCGWPSFSKPLAPELVKEKEDTTIGVPRIEIRSRAGDSHLGHVFTDGPEDKGGLRYCINSASMRFIPLADLEKEGYGFLSYLFTK